MKSYGETFAGLYNKKWSSFALQVAPRISQFYAKQELCDKNKNVLDLCCGTGHLANYFLKKDYNVTGIDISAGMLHYARKNNIRFIESGKAKFIEADATNFQLDEKFGLVVSTFDALNHLENIGMLKKCFACVYEITVVDGYFIFDLNTRKGLSGWTNIVVEDNEESMIVSRSFYDELNGRAITNMTGFSKIENGFFKRFVHSVNNTAFNLAEIKEALLEIGWKDVYFSRIKDLSMSIDEPENEVRIFVVAKK